MPARRSLGEGGSILLFPKDNADLGQIVRRQLDCNVVARHALLNVFERNGRQIFAELFAFPPGASPMFLRGRETVTVKRRANVARSSFRKGIFLERRRD